MMFQARDLANHCNDMMKVVSYPSRDLSAGIGVPDHRCNGGCDHLALPDESIGILRRSRHDC